MVKDEYTLVLVKPDGVKTRHIGEIITRIERKGYKIEALKMIQPTEELLRQHYACLLYTSPSPRDGATSRMPSSA